MRYLGDKMNNVDFTIHKIDYKETLVEITIRVENSLDKYYTFAIPKKRFNNMNDEQLEIEIYKVASTYNNVEIIDTNELKEKAERVKTSIANYNKEKLNK